MRVLITGASGFVGTHLLAALWADGGHEIIGISRSGAFPGIAHYKIDLTETSQLKSILEETKPEWIFHLAGYASPAKSFHEPDRAWTDNWGMTKNLFDSILHAKLNPVVLSISTGLIYGDADGFSPPYTETSELRPSSPYACSKAAADLMGYQYYRNHGLKIIRPRPFNHIGPGQSADYAIANFARQIAAIKLGLQEPILKTGNLNTERDLTDVRDIVCAYIALAKTGRAGEAYNLGQGKTVKIGAVLERLIEIADVNVRVEMNQDSARATDVATVKVDITKIQTEIGWAPVCPFERTISDTLGWWITMQSRA